jgi:polar amino acid transport system permease protein
MRLQWDWSAAAEALPHLIDGLKVTVLATAGGMLLALVLGLVLAVWRRARSRWIAWPAVALIEVIRSTPLLIQLYFAYFVFPDYGWNTPLVVGILVLGVHYATYTSEVYRSGIEGVPRGQWEAATALNLSPVRTWTRIILPQAIPPSVPALGNYLVGMFKDTPLLFAITVQELLAEARNYSAMTFNYVESYTLVGVIFLVLSLAAMALIRYTERRLVLR